METINRTFLCMYDYEDHDGAAKTEVNASSAHEAARAFAEGGDFPPNGRARVAAAEIDADGDIGEWETFVVERAP